MTKNEIILMFLLAITFIVLIIISIVKKKQPVNMNDLLRNTELEIKLNEALSRKQELVELNVQLKEKLKEKEVVLESTPSVILKSDITKETTNYYMIHKSGRTFTKRGDYLVIEKELKAIPVGDYIIKK